MVDAVARQPNAVLDAEIEKVYAECGDFMQSYEDKTIRIELRFSKIKACTMTFKFPPDESGVIHYPSQPAIFELKSTTMPAKLTQLLARRTMKHIEELAKANKDQVHSAYQFLANIMENNNLIPCWSEFALIKPLIEAARGDTLKPLEKAGKLWVTLKEGSHSAIVEFTVPPQYPMQKVGIQLKQHNFNEVFAQIFMAQAENIIRRLWNGGQPGYEPGDEDINEGKIGFKKAVGATQADLDRMKVATRAELKHDMDYINSQRALTSGKMDKQDRRAFKLNIKHEKRYEEGKQKEAEEERKMSQSLDDQGQTVQVTAKPQIYHAIKYLAEYFVRFLPAAMCAICENNLVTDLRAGVDDKGMMPERAFCGHWLHAKCFEEFINEPPFKRDCPFADCTKVLASNNFPVDATSVKQREKRWLQLQQKAGELVEMEKLFGVGEVEEEEKE